MPMYQPVVAWPRALVGFEALARFPLALRSPRDLVRASPRKRPRCGAGGGSDQSRLGAARAVLGHPPRPERQPLGAHRGRRVQGPAQDLSEVVIEITEHEFVADDETLATRSRAAGAGVPDRDRRCRRRLRRPEAADELAARHRQARPQPDQAIHTDPARMALIESFVRFAHRTGATVCAEGVESLDDLAILADLDVQWGQGFALAGRLRRGRTSRGASEPAAPRSQGARASSARGGGSPPGIASSSTSAPGSRPEPATTSRALGVDRGGARRRPGLPLPVATRVTESPETLARNSGPAISCFSLAEYQLTSRVLATRRRSRCCSAIRKATRGKSSCSSSWGSARC